MYAKSVVIAAPVGLRARPATLLIQKANEFNAILWLEKDERRINAKSLLGVLSLGVSEGEEVKIIGDGDDETDAVDALANLIVNDFLA